MHRHDGSMAWYGYVALPLTVTAGVAIFCAYQALWYGLGLCARTQEALTGHTRRPLSPLERF